MKGPRRVFLVPYRDRPRQRDMLLAQLDDFIGDQDDWEIFFVQQCDRRPFNRGAMKNIGFLAIRALYPDTYRDMTLIFHDVDTWPSWKGQFPYETAPGIVSHYYGVTFALGGVFAIRGGDFERTGGFANFWGWGLEDNVMQDRCVAAGLRIDRGTFFQVRDKAVRRAFDGFERVASRHEAATYKYGSPDSFRDLRGVSWSKGPGGMINVRAFTPATFHRDHHYESLDIRNGTRLRAQRRYLAPQRAIAHAGAQAPPATPSRLTRQGRKRIRTPLPAAERRWPPRWNAMT